MSPLALHRTWAGELVSRHAGVMAACRKRAGVAGWHHSTLEWQAVLIADVKRAGWGAFYTGCKCTEAA